MGAVNQGLSEYNPSAAFHAAREFFWSSLCDWYLELIKPRLTNVEHPSGPVARQVLAFCVDQVLRLLHPFVPFITEHLWQLLSEQVPERGLGELAPAPASSLLIQAPWPTL
jgi:valyl-tRNA synthetase